MSTTYSFFCPQTKKSLWVGQYSRTKGQAYLYDSEMKNIIAFLNAHVGLEIIFDADGTDTEMKVNYTPFQTKECSGRTNGYGGFTCAHCGAYYEANSVPTSCPKKGEI